MEGGREKEGWREGDRFREREKRGSDEGRERERDGGGIRHLQE